MELFCRVCALVRGDAGFTPLQDGAEDSHHIPPSPVVHVRGLCDAVVEADLVEALEKFGTIWYILLHDQFSIF